MDAITGGAFQFMDDRITPRISNNKYINCDWLCFYNWS